MGSQHQTGFLGSGEHKAIPSEYPDNNLNCYESCCPSHGGEVAARTISISVLLPRRSYLHGESNSNGEVSPIWATYSETTSVDKSQSRTQNGCHAGNIRTFERPKLGGRIPSLTHCKAVRGLTIYDLCKRRDVHVRLCHSGTTLPPNHGRWPSCHALLPLLKFRPRFP